MPKAPEKLLPIPCTCGSYDMQLWLQAATKKSPSQWVVYCGACGKEIVRGDTAGKFNW